MSNRIPRSITCATPSSFAPLPFLFPNQSWQTLVDVCIVCGAVVQGGKGVCPSLHALIQSHLKTSQNALLALYVAKTIKQLDAYAKEATRRWARVQRGLAAAQPGMGHR